MKIRFRLSLKWLLTCAVILEIGNATAQDVGSRYWSDSWRGWHFYEDPVPEEQIHPVLPDKATPTLPPTRPWRAPELVEFEHLQKSLEDTRNIAIMRPTESNVRHYMELESQVVARASNFADVAQRVAWATPELDPTLQRVGRESWKIPRFCFKPLIYRRESENRPPTPQPSAGNPEHSHQNDLCVPSDMAPTQPVFPD